MRLVLKITNPTNQRYTEKIRFETKDNETGLLLNIIASKIQVPVSEFIATVQKHQRCQAKLRILPKWDTQFYGIANGDQIQVRIVEKHDNPFGKNPGSFQNNYVKIEKNQLKDATSKDQVEGRQANLKEERYQDRRQEYQHEQQQDRTYRVLDQKYDNVLKIIQRKDFQDFLEVLQFKEVQGQCQRLYMKQRLEQMLSDIGSGGWAAIHIAIHCSKVEVLSELINYGIDVNKKTADGWLPIQLAINAYSAADNKTQQIINLLLQAPFIDLNIVTQKGTPLHNALATGDLKIIRKLLMKDMIDPFLKDRKGRTFQEAAINKQSIKLLKEYNLLCEDYLQNSIRLASIKTYKVQSRVYRGEVFEMRSFPMKPLLRYLVIDLFSGNLTIFKDRRDYLHNPKEVIPLLSLLKAEKKTKTKDSLASKQSIFFRFNSKFEHRYFCFVVRTTDKAMEFGCSFEQTTHKWVSAIMKSIQLAVALQKTPQDVTYSNKIETVIVDTDVPDLVKAQSQSPCKVAKKLKANLMDVFLKGYQVHNPQEKSQLQQQRRCEKKRNNDSIMKSQKTSETNSSGGSVKDIRINVSPKDMQAIRKSIKIQCTEEGAIKYQDFKFLSLLGQGAFGCVYLVKHVESGRNFALKVLQKKKMLIHKQVRFAASQINILKQLDNPFIMNLHFTFQTPNHIYLGLDYCPNKDLSCHLIKEGYFNEGQCRFYAAEILLALEHLHSKNILYRDLKPENILLDDEGHVKITDFGLSKQCVQNTRNRSNTFCGSPAYLSPEMVAKKGASKETDYYGLGAVIYEMMVGQPPFYDQDIKVLYQNITEGRLKFPKRVSNQSKSIISRLLQKNPQKRLGSKGIEQIKNHYFFRTIKWDKLYRREVKPPLRPFLEDNKVQQSNEFAQTTVNRNLIEKNLHFDEDYQPNKARVNKFLNFSFKRQSCFGHQQKLKQYRIL